MRDPFDTDPTCRLGDAKLSMLLASVRHETHPRHRPRLDLFTAAFSRASSPAILSKPEFKAQPRVNSAALAAKKADPK